MIFELVNASYVADEDRLMLRINTSNQEEFRLWLTRRLCLDLIIKIENLSLQDLNQKHTKVESKTIDSFNQERLEQQINFNTPYNPKSTLPFGAMPILIKDISIKTNASQDNTTLIDLILANNKVLTTNMPRKSLNSIRILLKNCCTQANWNTPPENTLGLNLKHHLEIAQLH